MRYQVTLSNYKEDKYYPKVVRVVGEILETSRTIKAVSVFQKLGVLSEINYKKWRSGQVRCLEFVLECNLSKANRIMIILSFHAHDLNMGKSHDFVKYKGKILHFSKSGAKKIEELYARQFNVVGK